MPGAADEVMPEAANEASKLAKKSTGQMGYTEAPVNSKRSDGEIFS